MIVYRNCDRRFPFLWEDGAQPEARWNRAGEGPVQYLADTPTGAWAEFLRHEEITEEPDLEGVSRALWAVEVDMDGVVPVSLDESVVTGGADSYPICQAEADRLHARGASGVRAASAALLPGAAAGCRVRGGLVDGPARDGQVYVLFGARPDALGWPVVLDGAPPAAVLHQVRVMKDVRQDPDAVGQ